MQIKKVHFNVIHSTNSWAKEQITQFDSKALTIITAEEQTAGRGRFTRRWVSPRGCNLYATYVFFTPTIGAIGNVTQILALSAHHVCAAYVPSIKIKWPNDLVIGPKKMGGILAEVVETPEGWGNIIGLGLNINMPKMLLETIDRPATSLQEECQQPLDLALISESVHERFQRDLTDYLKQGFAPFLTSFKEALIHQMGDRLQFHNYSEIIEGCFEGIRNDGSLNLRLPNNALQHCISGEIL